MVGIGGPTLGGSYKTPLSLAFARAMTETGVRVAIAAHGHAGTVRSARRVLPEDDAREVGDDAAWLARDGNELGISVFVGRHRSETVALGARHARLVVADALLQASPQRLWLSILSVDARTPWGSGLCPPAGDLRARKSALIAATDVLVAVTSDESRDAAMLADLESWALRAGKRFFFVRSSLSAASAATGRDVPLSPLAACRVGLVLAIARPERVTTALAEQGIVPAAIRLFPDHSVPPRPANVRVDAWLTTPKCATKLGSSYGGAPLVVLRQRLTLPDGLVGVAPVGSAAASP